MSINGMYHVYCLPTNSFTSNPRPFASEFSLLQVGGQNGIKLHIFTNAETGGKVELTGSGAGDQYTWTNSTTPAWEAKARFVDGIHSSTAKVLVGWVKRGEVKDSFVAFKIQDDQLDPDLLTAHSSFDLYYRKDPTTRTLSVSKNGNDLQFSFVDPDGESKSAKTPGGQTPARFTADKETNGYIIAGVLLPRFIKKDNDKHVVLVGHLVPKAQLGSSDHGPVSTDDIEPFVAVSKNPIVLEGDGAPS